MFLKNFFIQSNVFIIVGAIGIITHPEANKSLIISLLLVGLLFSSSLTTYLEKYKKKENIHV